ncbi:uncharacterized protein LOC125215611 isoform X2 [Salvia hispanica]|uniref:uncharacterized protein LOC125215611 isoform X2 n=1 Tax=Salvia hispanica TaxID=49212 RepID=UPI0020097A6F|nr:uncharacterized protein LOC125215611 isoform X2 [Salvia hispanica]
MEPCSQCPCIDGENGDGVQGYGTEEPEERASSSYPDLLIESINVLKTAQEALENEVLKFKEISQPTSVKYITLDAHPEFTDAGAKFRETSFVQLPTSEGIPPDSPRTLLSKLMEIENTDEQRELENLFVQRIEAEVEYVLISKMVQNHRYGTFAEQCQMLYKSGDKTTTFKKDSWKMVNFESTASADETLKLQKRYSFSLASSFVDECRVAALDFFGL